MGTTFKGIVIGVIGTCVVAALIGLFIIWTGAYDVRADKPHIPIVRWALHTTLENAIRRNGRNVEVPQLTPAMITAGAIAFHANCEGCHGAPGVEQHKPPRHMRPSPPDLVKVAQKLTPGDIFWVGENGIKMTAMPAMGHVVGKKTLWDIVAFVHNMPGMTPQHYQALINSKASQSGQANQSAAKGSGKSAQG